MVSGGLVLFGAVWVALQIKSEPGAYALCFVGAAFGGFWAGRASEGRTVAEPAVGAVLLAGTALVLVSLLAGIRQLMALSNTGALWRLLLVAAALAGGGVVGAVLGERSQPDRRTVSNVRWVGVASLIIAGQLMVFFTVFAAVLITAGVEADDAGGIVVFIALVLGALVGGFTAQAVAPRRMIWGLGLGYVPAMAPGIVWSAVSGDSDAAMGFVLFAAIGVAVTAGGARLGWRLIGSKYERSVEQLAATFE